MFMCGCLLLINYAAISWPTMQIFGQTKSKLKCEMSFWHCPTSVASALATMTIPTVVWIAISISISISFHWIDSAKFAIGFWFMLTNSLADTFRRFCILRHFRCTMMRRTNGQDDNDFDDDKPQRPRTAQSVARMGLG